MQKIKTHNKAVIGTFFASLHFGVASPLYPKLRYAKNAPYSGVSCFMRNLLLLNLWCFLAVGCTSAKLQPYQVWSSLETPSIFKMNELWVFVILDKEGSIKQRLTVKFTDATAETCASNEWRKLEIVDEYPQRSGSFLGKPAYYLNGAALIVDLSSNLCDAGYELKGQIEEAGVAGEHYPVSMFGGEVQGMFYGVPANGN